MAVGIRASSGDRPEPGAPHVELSVRPHRGGDRAVRVSRGDASRVDRGMHYLTDVLAGALASGIWLTAVLVLLLAPRPRACTAALEPNPTQLRR